MLAEKYAQHSHSDPALPGQAERIGTMRYSIPYEVDAETPFAAIVKATELLRTGVKVEHVKRVEASVPGWYYVDLEVSEPDTPEAREDHEENHPEMVEGCGLCENRAEKSAAYWERAMRTY